MSAQLDTILPKMEATHAKFKAYVAALDTDAALRPAAGNAWNPREIVGHLVDAERAHRRFIEAVAGGTPPAKVENFDLHAWNAARLAKRAHQSLAELLAAYDEERQATVALLKALPDEAWEKSGDHAALGHVTVEYVARIIGLHERAHLQEMGG
jgi:uncharacterized damage-inducible protein DinB